MSQEFGLQRSYIRAVAIGALRRRQLINDDRLRINQARLLVTLVTSDLCVASLQGEMSPGIVVENRRHPALCIVTIRAMRFPALLKLTSVRILVTILTDLRCAFELYVLRADRNFVAGSASNGAMRSEQRECRFRMIKPVDVGP